MSSNDRDRWDARYAAGAYGTRLHPSAMLENWLQQQAPRRSSAHRHRALDVACGAGRNSLFLAQQGYAVLGLDISTIAITQARAKADAMPTDAGLVKPVFREQDLDLGLGINRQKVGLRDLNASKPCQLVCMFRYLDLTLIDELMLHLAQDGVLLVEVNLQIPPDPPAAGVNLAGPPATPEASRFRAAPGALLAAVRAGEAAQPTRQYHIELAEEGWFKDPDGADASLARVIVRRQK